MDTAGPFGKQDYLARMNRVIDYVDEHLEQDLPLSSLCRIAHFSPFHFHRIFKAVVGETTNRYVQRRRVEKAAARILYHPDESITDIAFDCGFSSSQFFANVFKKHFGISPKAYRKKYGENSKIVQVPYREPVYSDDRIKLTEPSVKIMDLKDMHVIYTRHIGPYQGDEKLFRKMFTELFQWAGSQQLLGPETKVISLYNDLPEITEEDKLRLTACITVPEHTQASGSFGRLTIAGGAYAVARCDLSKDAFETAWSFMYRKWLLQSGFLPDDKPAFELLLNNPDDHPENRYIVDICLPVTPAN